MLHADPNFIATIRSTLSDMHIELAIVFGSTARGTADGESDLDLAVDAGHILNETERIALIEAMAEKTGRPVDLVDLRVAGEPILGKILSTGVLVLGNKAQRASLIRRHVFDTADFMPYRTRILRKRREAWIAR